MNHYIKSLILLISIVFFISACKNSTEPDDNSGNGNNETNSIIFGTYYGECWGPECMKTFHLEGNKLQEDTLDNYACQAPYSWVELSNEQYKEASHLFSHLPEEAFAYQSQTFGIPDAYDQGGIYLESYSPDGSIRKWNFDNERKQVPEIFHPLMDSIHAIIDRIK